jgi:1-acyl-sn-glycerol-3-phosphate acyltransferase
MILSIIRITFILFFSAFMATCELLITPFHRTGKLFHTLARFYGKGVLRASGVTLNVVGLERVDFSRSYIYVSNHASLFDIPSVLVGIPDQIRIIYKKELEKIPIFGWGLKYGKTYIGIDRGKGPNAIQSLEEAVNKIRNGASVILFGEGTRSSDGNLQPFKRGPFNLALRAGVPVVPVTIKGSFDILSKKSFRIRPGVITLILDAPLSPPEKTGKDTELALSDAVRSIIQKNLSEA